MHLINRYSAVRLFVSGAALSLLAACGGSGGIGEDETVTHLRVFNAIGDSPSLQFMMDTTVVATGGLGNGSAYSAAPAGSHAIQLRTVRPGRISGDTGTTDPVNLGAPLTQTFAGDQDYTVIAAGTMAAPQVFTISAPNQRDAVAATKLVWRLVHATAGGPAVDVYLTAPEAGIATPQLITSSVGFRGATDTRELTLVRQAGQADTAVLYVKMTIELRAAGTSTVLFNSGPLQFDERNRLLFAITPNTDAPQGRSVQLATLAADGASGLTRDPTDPATIRLVNMSYNAPALDLLRLTPAQTLATNVAFGAASTRGTTANGSLDLLARETATPANVLFVSQFSAIRAQAYSIYATGPAASLDDVILGDDRRVVPTQARFRFVHAAGSLSASTLDVYLTRVGVPPDFNSADDTVTADDAANVRQLSALAYRGAGGYVSLEGGTYDVYFATAGATTTLVGPIPTTFANGSIQTVVLTDTAANTLGIRVVNDTLN